MIPEAEFSRPALYYFESGWCLSNRQTADHTPIKKALIAKHKQNISEKNISEYNFHENKMPGSFTVKKTDFPKAREIPKPGHT